MPILNPERLVASLNKLFLTLPLPTANADPDEALRVYYEECQGYSNDDVDLAVRQFMSGTVENHNPSFAPTAAQFARQLRSNLNYRADQNHRRSLLLTQFREQELDEEWQQKRSPEAKAFVKEVIDAMKKKEAERTPEERQMAQEWLHKTDRHFESRYVDECGVKVSKYLVDKLRNER